MSIKSRPCFVERDRFEPCNPRDCSPLQRVQRDIFDPAAKMIRKTDLQVHIALHASSTFRPASAPSTRFFFPRARYHSIGNSLVEMTLQVLVGIIDQQLLQAVVVELFESVDIQHSDEAPHIAGRRHASITVPKKKDSIFVARMRLHESLAGREGSDSHLDTVSNPECVSLCSRFHRASISGGTDVNSWEKEP